MKDKKLYTMLKSMLASMLRQRSISGSSFDAIRLETANRIKVHRYSVGIAVFTTALLSFQPSAGGGWPNCQGGEKRTKAESRSFLFPLLFSSFFFFLFYFSFRLGKYRVSHLYTDKNHRNSKCCGFVVPQYRTRPIEIAPPTLATE